MAKFSLGTEQHSAVELKHLNLQSVYSCLYSARELSRLEISYKTGLSLPTVASNINELEERGLVVNGGEQKSTGGRRALAFRCDESARIAIGAEILKEGIKVCAIDLYGKIIMEGGSATPFNNTEEYYAFFGGWINKFIDSLEVDESKILGVGISLQGLVSADGETVVYSEILKCTGTKRDRFQKYIKLSTTIMHDTEAAALAEIWHDESASNVVYFALNRYFGGTMIINGQLHNTMKMSSSVIEHMCLDPHGPKCYCGKSGCIETFCSVHNLLESAGMDVIQFFASVRNGDERINGIWNEFLHNLALAIENIRMVADCDFILGGYLVQFMDDDDYRKLSGYVDSLSFLKSSDFILRKSRFGDKAPMLGAAIHHIDHFLEDIG